MDINSITTAIYELNFRGASDCGAEEAREKIVEHLEKKFSNRLEKLVSKSEHTEGSSANGAVADIKEIIYTALEEITAIDQALRLEPGTIYNPLELRKAENTAFKATCAKYNIAYTEKDLRPEGDEQLKNIWNLIKNK